MSWFLADRAGYVGDFATTIGLRQMREAGLPALKEFVEAGKADEELGKKVSDETEGSDHYDYIAKLLAGASFPVIITDGLVEDDGTAE